MKINVGKNKPWLVGSDAWKKFTDEMINTTASHDVRLRTATNAISDSLYAIEAGDAKHAATILRDTLERLNQN